MSADWEFNDMERRRARKLLLDLLPEFKDKDECRNHLWYVNYQHNEELRLFSIAAAVHVIMKGKIDGV